MYSEEINRRDDRDERDHRDGFRDAYDRRDEGRFRRDDRRDSRRDGYGSYDDYTTDEIQSEVDRLRYELNTLKRTIDERRADSQEIKSAIVHSEAVYSQQLAEIGKLLEDLGNILNGVQVGIDTKLKNIPSKVSEEIEDAMIPVANKCEIIDERIKAMSSSVDNITGPIDEKMEDMNRTLTDTLASKFGSKNIGDVLKKLSSVSIFVTANMIGTITLLVLMCYFIISLS